MTSAARGLPKIPETSRPPTGNLSPRKATVHTKRSPAIIESGTARSGEATCLHGVIKFQEIIAAKDSFVDFEWGPNITSIYD